MSCGSLRQAERETERASYAFNVRATTVAPTPFDPTTLPITTGDMYDHGRGVRFLIFTGLDFWEVGLEEPGTRSRFRSKL